MFSISYSILDTRSAKILTSDCWLVLLIKKQNKGGAAYASGKTLIVFLNKQGGEWYPNRVAKSLPHVDFESVWVVGLQNVINGEYNYNVTQLNANGCPIWQIHIKKTFDDWEIKRIQ